MTEVTPEAGRRYRRAAAFLIHWRDHDRGALGAHAIWRELREDGPQATAEFIAALGSLFWETVQADDELARLATGYLKAVASASAVAEAGVSPG